MAIFKGMQMRSWHSEVSDRAPGTRAAPTRTAVSDSKIGVRLDSAETVEKGGKLYKRYKLQANKNASNPTIKEAAQRDLCPCA